MWDIRDVENPQTRLPIGAVDVGPSMPRIIHIVTRPFLAGHIVNVNPATSGCFPSHLSLTNLDNSRQAVLQIEIEMGDGDATTSIPLSDVALGVIGIGYQDVPFFINHLCVEIVGSAGMIEVIP